MDDKLKAALEQIDAALLERFPFYSIRSLPMRCEFRGAWKDDPNLPHLVLLEEELSTLIVRALSEPRPEPAPLPAPEPVTEAVPNEASIDLDDIKLYEP